MKTLNLINQHLKKLHEQVEGEAMAEVADATGAPAGAVADATDISEQPDEDQATPLTAEGEKFLIQLLIKAFLHVPDEPESKIIKELQSTVLDSNPKQVADTIENLLKISPLDTKQTLNLTTDL